MRATTLLNRLLDLPGAAVSGASWRGQELVVDVRLRAKRLTCPLCRYTTRAGYDKRPVPSRWRGLDFGSHTVTVRALLRRLDCPEHGVRVQAVPFARHGSRFTRDFEDVTAFLATKTDKTTIARFLRIDWDTVGRICERVVDSELDPARLEGLVNIGVDEISWRKHHNYLTLVTDHDAKKVVWGKAGKDTATPVGREFLYSSGTTGLPKGIRRPMIPYAYRDQPEWDMSWKSLYEFREGMVYLSPAPLYHAAPHTYVRRAISEGGTAVVMGKFDPERALALIEEHRVTHSQWVPTMFVRLLALPEEVRARADLSSHRMAFHAAAPCPIPVKQAMIAWWGPMIREYYAGSEGVGTTVASSAEWLARPGTVGKPVNDVKVHICDENGQKMPPREVGRIWFEGAPRFAYHNAPEKTAEAYNEQGWGTLGDLGWVDEEGWLYLSDRRADLILSGGVNLYPAEIEAELARHPDVAEVAVVGVPHADMGEQVHAVIVPRAGTAPDAATLTSFVQERLAGPKRPRSYEFVKELPRSEAGKLLRRILKERYLPDQPVP